MTPVTLLATEVSGLGGVQSVLWQLAAELEDAGHAVRVAALNQPDAREAEVSVLVGDAAWERLLGEAAWERLGLRKTRRLRLRPLARRRAARRLRVLAGDGVVLAMDVASVELARRARLPHRTVAAHHNSYAAIRGTGDDRRLRRATAGMAALVALTGPDASAFRAASYTAKEVLSIPNAIRVSSQADDDERRPFVLAAGRYHPQKAFDVLLEAWSRTRARGTHRLVIVGQGPEQEALEQLRVRLGLDSVEIRPPADVRTKLNGASLFVLSSRYEGLPLVLLEAMSAGVPIVATDCAPSIHELLDDPQAGIVVPVGSPSDLASAIDAVLGDDELARRLADGGLVAVERYSPDRILPQWVSLFERVRASPLH